jgi:putative flippase GtrA
MSRLVLALNLDLPRLIRFGVVGVGCAALYAALAWGLTTIGGMSPVAASVAAYSVAGVASYLGQKLFTFQSDAPHADAAPRFLAVFLVGIAIATAAPLLMTERMHLPPLAAIVFTCGVVPLVNYGVLGSLVFRRAVAGPNP